VIQQRQFALQRIGLGRVGIDEGKRRGVLMVGQGHGSSGLAWQRSDHGFHVQLTACARVVLKSRAANAVISEATKTRRLWKFPSLRRIMNRLTLNTKLWAALAVMWLLLASAPGTPSTPSP
jgi:hypothetical protein